MEKRKTAGDFYSLLRYQNKKSPDVSSGLFLFLNFLCKKKWKGSSFLLQDLPAVE